MSRKKFLVNLKTLLVIFAVTILLVLTITAQPVGASFANNIDIDSLNYLANQERVQNGLPTLSINEKLEKAALDKANHMFLNDYWDHVAPDGTEPWVFIKNNNYSYKSAGENLAKGFSYSSEVVDGWMNSLTHKANVLKDSYTDVGYAVVSGMLIGEETTLVVAMYGERKTTTVESSLSNDYVATKGVTTSLKTNGVESSYVTIVLTFALSIILAIRLMIYKNKIS